MNKQREIVFYKEYFRSYVGKQDLKVRKKIFSIIELVKVLDFIPTKFFKHLEGTKGLYEIRIVTREKSIRVFCFFDKGKLVVIGNAFDKKTQKTPKSELEKAHKIKQEYFDEKNNDVS